MRPAAEHRFLLSLKAKPANRLVPLANLHQFWHAKDFL